MDNYVDLESLSEIFLDLFKVRPSYDDLGRFGAIVGSIENVRDRAKALEAYARSAYKVMLLRDLDNEVDICNCVLLGDESLIRKYIMKSNEFSRVFSLSEKLHVPDYYPKNHLVFDHIYKTGGTAIAEVLRSLFKGNLVSPHIDRNDYSEINSALIKTACVYPIIVGHLGSELRRNVLKISNRKRVSIVRSPVSWVRSVYTFWRGNILAFHPAYYSLSVSKAREMEFSDFIRDEQIRSDVLINGQLKLLSGIDDVGSYDLRTLGLIIDILFSEFDYIGKTEDLIGTLKATLDLLGLENEYDCEHLIGNVERNESSIRISVTDEDRIYIDDICRCDGILYDRVSNFFE